MCQVGQGRFIDTDHFRNLIRLTDSNLVTK